jgi:hypothetical protein
LTNTVQRRYSVQEIDELRRVLEYRWMFGSCVISNGPRVGRCYREAEKTAAVEELVRTAMLAGLTAKNIVDAENKPNVKLRRDVD